jgi:hypothetical protein
VWNHGSQAGRMQGPWNDWSRGTSLLSITMTASQVGLGRTASRL